MWLRTGVMYAIHLKEDNEKEGDLHSVLSIDFKKAS